MLLTFWISRGSQTTLWEPLLWKTLLSSLSGKWSLNKMKLTLLNLTIWFIIFIVKILCFIYGKTCYIHMRSLCVCIAKQQQQHSKPLWRRRRKHTFTSQKWVLLSRPDFGSPEDRVLCPNCSLLLIHPEVLLFYTQEFNLGEWIKYRAWGKDQVPRPEVPLKVKNTRTSWREVESFTGKKAEFTYVRVEGRPSDKKVKARRGEFAIRSSSVKS